MADMPPPPPSNQPPPAGGWQPPPAPVGGQPPPQQGAWQPPPQQGWQQPPQQVVVKQGSGCLKAALIVFGILVVLGIIGVASLFFLGNQVVKEIGKSTGTAAATDYKVSNIKCLIDEGSTLKATGEIKNTSDKDQAFHVTVRWETTNGDLIGVDSTYTDKLKIGQKQLWNTTTFEDVPEGATAKCEVSKVEYTIFGN